MYRNSAFLLSFWSDSSYVYECKGSCCIYYEIESLIIGMQMFLLRSVKLLLTLLQCTCSNILLPISMFPDILLQSFPVSFVHFISLSWNFYFEYMFDICLLVIILHCVIHNLFSTFNLFSLSYFVHVSINI